MEKREYWIDQAKGITMVFVLVGHVIGGLLRTKDYLEYNLFLSVASMIIFTFVMPVFFAISGLLFRRIMDFRHLKKMFLKKFIGLGVPYLIFSVLYVFLQSFSTDINNRYSFDSIATIYITPISYLWYLLILFYIYLLIALLDLLTHSNKLEFLVVTCAALYVLIKPTQIYLIDSTLLWAVPFLIGRNYKEILRVIDSNILLFLSFGIVLVSLLLQFKFIPKYYSTNGITKYNFISKIASITFLLPFFNSIQNKRYSFLEKIGKYSLVYYLVHVPIVSISRIVLMKVGVKGFYDQFLFEIVIALGICYITVIFTEKFKIIDFIFSPTKYLLNNHIGEIK